MKIKLTFKWVSHILSGNSIYIVLCRKVCWFSFYVLSITLQWQPCFLVTPMSIQHSQPFTAYPWLSFLSSLASPSLQVCWMSLSECPAVPVSLCVSPVCLSALAGCCGPGLESPPLGRHSETPPGWIRCTCQSRPLTCIVSSFSEKCHGPCIPSSICSQPCTEHFRGEIGFTCNQNKWQKSTETCTSLSVETLFKVMHLGS
jgi:hypothetical protein